MSIHLALFALQSLPRIAARLGIRLDFPSFYSLYGLSPTEFENVLRKVHLHLKRLIKEYDITWWDIHLESDIGFERILLVKELELSSED